MQITDQFMISLGFGKDRMGQLSLGPLHRTVQKDTGQPHWHIRTYPLKKGPQTQGDLLRLLEVLEIPYFCQRDVTCLCQGGGNPHGPQCPKA